MARGITQSSQCEARARNSQPPVTPIGLVGDADASCTSFFAIRWSLLIGFGSNPVTPQLYWNEGVVSTLVSYETINGFAELLLRYERRRTDP